MATPRISGTSTASSGTTATGSSSQPFEVPKGVPVFRSAAQLFRDSDACSDDTDQYVLKGVSEANFETITRVRERLGRRDRLFYFAETKLLIITRGVTSHSAMHACLYGDIYIGIHSMGLGNNWVSLGATTRKSQHGFTRGSGEAESSGRPSPSPTGRRWQTLVLHAADSHSLPEVRMKMRWWFAASEGQVKIVLLTQILHSHCLLVIEKWVMSTPSPRPGAMRTRSIPDPQPVKSQVIKIRVIDETAIYDDASYEVQGGPLKLEFDLLFLRQPRKDTLETDVVITDATLRNWASKSWSD